jgi:hypothetical protein
LEFFDNAERKRKRGGDERENADRLLSLSLVIIIVAYSADLMSTSLLNLLPANAQKYFIQISKLA